MVLGETGVQGKCWSTLFPVSNINIELRFLRNSFRLHNSGFGGWPKFGHKLDNCVVIKKIQRDAPPGCRIIQPFQWPLFLERLSNYIQYMHCCTFFVCLLIVCNIVCFACIWCEIPRPGGMGTMRRLYKTHSKLDIL